MPIKGGLIESANGFLLRDPLSVFSHLGLSLQLQFLQHPVFSVLCMIIMVSHIFDFLHSVTIQFLRNSLGSLLRRSATSAATTKPGKAESTVIVEFKNRIMDPNVHPRDWC
jgi:hypothetical protein